MDRTISGRFAPPSIESCRTYRARRRDRTADARTPCAKDPMSEIDALSREIGRLREGILAICATSLRTGSSLDPGPWQTGPMADRPFDPILAVPGSWRWVAVHNGGFRFTGRVRPTLHDTRRTTGRWARTMNRHTAVVARLAVATDRAPSAPSRSHCCDTPCPTPLRGAAYRGPAIAARPRPACSAPRRDRACPSSERSPPRSPRSPRPQRSPLQLARQSRAGILHLRIARLRFARMHPVLVETLVRALGVEPGQILPRRRLDPESLGQLLKSSLVTGPLFAAYDRAQRRGGFQRRGVHAQDLGARQPRGPQPLGHPGEHHPRAPEGSAPGAFCRYWNGPAGYSTVRNRETQPDRVHAPPRNAALRSDALHVPDPQHAGIHARRIGPIMLSAARWPREAAPDIRTACQGAFRRPA